MTLLITVCVVIPVAFCAGLALGGAMRTGRLDDTYRRGYAEGRRDGGEG